jgi:hypothetical protein
MNIDELLHYMMKGEQQNSAIPVPRGFSLLTVSIIYTSDTPDLAYSLLFWAIKSRQI